MNRFAKMKKERIYTLFETLSKVMVILPRIRGEDTSFSKLIQSLLVAHTVRIG